MPTSPDNPLQTITVDITIHVDDNDPFELRSEIAERRVAAFLSMAYRDYRHLFNVLDYEVMDAKETRRPRCGNIDEEQG